MFFLSLIATVVGVIIGVAVLLCAKKSPALHPSKDEEGLKKTQHLIGVLLIPTYVVISPFAWFLALVSEAYQDGFLGVLGWIVAVIISIAPLFFGSGLGFAYSLNRKGKIKAAFFVQLAGLAAVALSFVLYAVFVGSLLTPLN